MFYLDDVTLSFKIRTLSLVTRPKKRSHAHVINLIRRENPNHLQRGAFMVPSCEKRKMINSCFRLKALLACVNGTCYRNMAGTYGFYFQ